MTSKPGKPRPPALQPFPVVIATPAQIAPGRKPGKPGRKPR